MQNKFENSYFEMPVQIYNYCNLHIWFKIAPTYSSYPVQYCCYIIIVRFRLDWYVVTHYSFTVT